MVDTMKINVEVQNVPDYAKNKSGFMVCSQNDEELWFYGIYDDLVTAKGVRRFVTNAIILKCEV